MSKFDSNHHLIILHPFLLARSGGIILLWRKRKVFIPLGHSRRFLATTQGKGCTLTKIKNFPTLPIDKNHSQPQWKFGPNQGVRSLSRTQIPHLTANLLTGLGPIYRHTVARKCISRVKVFTCLPVKTQEKRENKARLSNENMLGRIIP